MSRIFVWPLLPLALGVACNPAQPTSDGPAPATSRAETAAIDETPPAGEPAVGEHASYAVEGDVVKVNNHLCAVSRGGMGPDVLGRFVSRVTYDGDDPRFQGKTLEFNQCCEGCVARFPKMWAERADEILAFHGLAGDR